MSGDNNLLRFFTSRVIFTLAATKEAPQSVHHLPRTRPVVELFSQNALLNVCVPGATLSLVHDARIFFEVNYYVIYW